MKDEIDDDALENEWDNLKTAMMDNILGKEHDMVMHALIPFAMGGNLDLYYYPNGIAGTGIATKELSNFINEGPSNDVFKNYELVMFTRHPIALDDSSDSSTPFGQVHQSINIILNCIASYSTEATLNPHETCEFPEDMETVGGKCLIFDAYRHDPKKSDFGMLAIIEIHRSEMEYAMKHGGEKLIEKLKKAGHYPYSDLDRPAVA